MLGKKVPQLLLERPWLSALVVAAAWISLAFLVLDWSDQVGLSGLIAFALISCGFLWLFQWILADRRPKPPGQIEVQDFSDVMQAARETSKEFLDERSAVISLPRSITSEEWNKVLGNFTQEIERLCSLNSGSSFLGKSKSTFDSKSTFTVAKNNEQIQIAITKLEFGSAHPAGLDSRCEVTITIARLLRHRKRLLQFPLLIIALFLLIAFFFDVDVDGFSAMLVLFLCVLVYAGQYKRVKKESKRNVRAFPATEVSQWLSSLKDFMEADFNARSQLKTAGQT